MDQATAPTTATGPRASGEASTLRSRSHADLEEWFEAVDDVLAQLGEDHGAGRDAPHPSTSAALN